MARNNYSAGKRQRERERERKKKEKAQRRAENRAGGGDVPTATVEELQGGNLMSIEEVMRDQVERALAETIKQKRVTYDLERQMEGATLLKTSEYGEAIVGNL